jgi:hypothetical protein
VQIDLYFTRPEQARGLFFIHSKTVVSYSYPKEIHLVSLNSCPGVLLLFFRCILANRWEAEYFLKLFMLFVEVLVEAVRWL